MKLYCFSVKKVCNSAITASLECWIFYFLKTTTNGETSDNRSRFQISIQLIFVKCFWDGWLSTRIGPRLSIKNNELFPLQNTIQNTIIIIVFSFVQDFFDLPSPIFWDTFNSASTLTFNLSLSNRWISISQLVFKILVSRSECLKQPPNDIIRIASQKNS